MDLGEGEAGSADVVLAEEGVVAAGRLGPALQDVAGDDRARERVEVVAGPAEVRGGRAGDQRGVGDPAGDDHVRAGPQALGDAGAAEVGVGGEHALAPRAVAGPAVGEQVVAGDVRDAGGHAEAVGELGDPLGEAGGVEPAGVGDDSDPVVHGQAQPLLELGEERPGVPPGRVLQPVPAEDQHRQLGEVVPRQHVQGTAGEHLAQGVEAVAVEAGGVADA